MVRTELTGVARLKQALGDAGAIQLLAEHAQGLRGLLGSFPEAVEVGSGNGSFLLVFAKPSDAVRFAFELQARAVSLGGKAGHALQERVGIHVGEVLVEVPEGDHSMRGLNGIHVDICEAILSLAGPGHILMTRFAHDSARQALKSGPGPGARDLAWVHHGAYQIEGADEPVQVSEVARRGRLPAAPPEGNDRIRRVVIGGELVGDAGGSASTSFLQSLRAASVGERRAAVHGSILVALVGLALLGLRWADGPSYDWLYLMQKPRAMDDVVIIGLDDASIGTLASGQHRSLATWDRSLYTRLMDRMTDAGARRVVFDVLFEDPKGAVLTNGFVESATDRGFKAALERSGRAMLGARWVADDDKVIAPSPLFRKPGAWGLVEQSEDASTVIRRPMTTRLDIRPLGELLVAPEDDVRSRTPPRAWLRYYGPPGTLRMVPFMSALSPDELPSSVVSNKVVFVGGASRVVPDKDAFPSPYSRWRPADIHGVEVNATRFLNQARGDWLRRLPWWVEVALVWMLGGAGAYPLVFLSPTRGVAVGLACALAVGLALAGQAWATGFWFPWLIVTVVQGPVAVIWAALARNRLDLEQARQVRRALDVLRSGAGSHPVGVQAEGPGGTWRVQGRGPAGPVSPADPARPGVPAVPDHEMLRCIGKGAYGEVWIARDVLGRYKAVKTIRRDAFEDQEPFDREFRGLQKFTPISRSHPGLVHVLHVGRNDVEGFIYYMMEIGDDVAVGQVIVPETYTARTLGADLERHGRIPMVTLLEHGVQILEALAHLHGHQLVHRDIKPANILFVDGRPKLADVGLVASIAAPGQEVSLVGTRGYMPPEGHGTPSADLYSVGKLLYVAASSRSVQHFPAVPRAIVEAEGGDGFAEFMGVLLRACEPIPEERYQDARSFMEDLRGLQQRWARPRADGG